MDDNDTDESIPTKWTRKAWQEYTTTHTSSTTVVKSSQSQPQQTEAKSQKFVEAQANGQEKQSTEKVEKKKKSSRGRPRKVAVFQEELSQPASESASNQHHKKSSDLSEKVIEPEPIVHVDENANVTAVTEQPELLASDSHQHSRRGRPKKAKKSSTGHISSKRRPKGVNLASLSVLHEKTLQSMQVDYTVDRPAKGCVDQKLFVRHGTHLLDPNIVVVNNELSEPDVPSLLTPPVQSGDPVKMTIDDHVLLYKYKLMKFNQFLKTQEFRESILNKIKMEQVRILIIILVSSFIFVF